MSRRLIVGMTGASGGALGVRLLELLAQEPVEVHLVVSEAGARVLAHETGRDVASLAPLVAAVHGNGDLFAPIASGSFAVDGMVVVPCSMGSLAAIAAGTADRLLLRAADVCLKERRRLVLVTRETPLSLIHLENMRRVTLAGAIVMPPVVTLYTRPAGIADVVDQIVGKILDLLGIDNQVLRRWS
jgi:4-hydroxy-3-polyprenylbenzoate decarboxylase